MGKSPGKWIKTVLFGKKPARSSTGKGKEKAAHEREIFVPGIVKASEADAGLGAMAVSNLTVDATGRTERNLEPEVKETLDLPHDEELPSGIQETNSQGSISQYAASDPESIRQERAATTVQAAFRSYLARRAFHALKGIIRLQALIRGHLVRRQAVATLSCVLGIVKLQALARGRKVRCSGIGKEVYDKCSLVETMEGKLVNSNGVDIAVQMEKLSANAFVRKLLISSVIVIPLRLHYEPSEPNSVANWVERWSGSWFWKPVRQPKKPRNSKTHKKVGNGQMVESETARPKRSVRRVPAANIDTNPGLTPSEYEKPKRNFRKVSSHSADTVNENPQSELEKVKRNLRKVHNPVGEKSVKLGIEHEKSEQNVENESGTSGDNGFGQSISSGEKTKNETNLTTSKELNGLKTDLMLPEPELPVAEPTPEPFEMNKASYESCADQVVGESKPLVDNATQNENTPISNGDVISKDEPTSNENNRSGRRTQNKQERAENVLQSSPTLPSYMAATESAKAKLRLQGSPRLSHDGAEKTSRRHSLPSPTSAKISSQSPRTQKAVNGSGKGVNKSEKSVLSSRDGNAKGVQVEWRR